MHVRFSTCVGMSVTVESTEETVGYLYDMLIQPDTGKIEGFFVEIPRPFSSLGLFLSSMDILRWGTSIYVRHAEAVSDPSDHLRIAPILEDGRTFLWQRIRTDAGKDLGACKDVQFDTDRLQVEWIFPKKCFRWGIALPVTEILEVRPDAIIVRDAQRPVKRLVKKTSSQTAAFDSLADAAQGLD